MKAVILCHEPPISSSLAALCAGRSPWLLPIAGKPLLEFQLETLALMGIRSVLLLGAETEIQQKYGQGHALGLELTYAPVANGLDPTRTIPVLLPALRSFSEGQDLVVIHELTLTLPRHAPHCLRLRQSLVMGTGVWGLKAEDLTPQRLTKMTHLPAAPLLETHRISDTPSFWLAHLWLAEKAPNFLHLPAYGEQAGILLGSRVQLAQNLDLQGPGLIGDHCKLAPNVSISQSWLGKGVVVGQGTALKQCVVLDGTWIGPGLKFENKLIAGQLCLDIASGHPLDVVEPAWLDQLPLPQETALLLPLQNAFKRLTQILYGSLTKLFRFRQDRQQGLVSLSKHLT